MAVDLVAENDLLQRWLARHQLAESVARWKQADEIKGPSLAFTAIAIDSRVLLRLESGPAGVMARQAQQMIEAVGEMRDLSPETRSAVRIVGLRIQSFREHVASGDHRANKRLTARSGRARQKLVEQPASALSTEEQLRIAVRDHPHCRPAIAPALLQMALVMGPDGLARASHAIADVIALATARLAARRWRGVVRQGGDAARGDCVAAVGIVQEWAFRTGRTPFIVDLSERCASPALRALSLAADAAACAAFAATLPGGVNAPGFAMWEDAEEFHAFGALSSDAGCMDSMEYDSARIFASAATRHGRAILADASIRVPCFPSGFEVMSASRVIAQAALVLAAGVIPRRMAGGISSPA